MQGDKKELHYEEMNAEQLTILVRRGYKRYKKKVVKRRQQNTVKFPVGYREETSVKERKRRRGTAWLLWRWLGVGARGGEQGMRCGLYVALEREHRRWVSLRGQENLSLPASHRVCAP